MSEDRWLCGWALGYAAVGAASLLVPLYALELGGSAFLVGLLAATAAFAGVPGAILWGRLAARSGRRRRFVLVALGATAGVLALVPLVGTPLVPLPTAGALLVLNAALWFVVAAAAPVLNLVVVEGVPADRWERRFGVLNHYQGYGWLAGLVAGAVWSAVATRFVSPLAAQRLFFVLSAVAALGGLLLVRLWYPDPSEVSLRRFVRGYRRLKGDRSWRSGRVLRVVPFGPNRLYWSLRTLDLDRARERFSPGLFGYLLAATCCFVGFSVFFGPLPAYLDTAGYTTDEVFTLFVLSGVGSAVSYARVGDLSTERDPRRLQTGALAARAVCFPLVAVFGTTLPPTVGLVVVGGVFVLVGVTWAVVAVTATGLVTRLAPDRVRGEALGVYTALSSVGGGLGSAVGGALATWVGYLPTFGTAAGLVVAGLVLVDRSGR
jgi:MFS family permease